jgi:hypothetical protein
MGWGADGKPVPTELRKEAHALRQQIELEDTRTAQLSTHIDDEYARATEADPKVLLTTSREPSSRLSQFAKVNPPRPPARSPASEFVPLGGWTSRALGATKRLSIHSRPKRSVRTRPHGPPTRSTAAAGGGPRTCTHAHTPVAYHAPTGL